VASALVLAAFLTPWLYDWGKSLASTAAAEQLPGIFEWLGAASGRAKLGRFFSRALMISALALLPVLFWRLRAMASGGAVPLAKLPLRLVVLQFLTGCVIAGGLLWGMGWLIQYFGAYVDDPTPPATGKLLKKVLPAALIAPLLEEWLFRGLLLGLWLKYAKPVAACLGTSLVFAFIHFLEPPAGMAIANPGSPWAGFELLGKILFHFADPRFFVTDFATLFGIGMILSWARLRTGALWFPIGLHAGWILAFKAYNLLHHDVAGHFLHPWGVGDSLRSGLIPLATLAVTAWVCHWVMPKAPTHRAVR
jgi:membrane protease YdiL (CAAX protease family)